MARALKQPLTSVRMLSLSDDDPGDGVFSVYARVFGVDVMVSLDTGANQVSCISEHMW